VFGAEQRLDDGFVTGHLDPVARPVSWFRPVAVWP
jgi:hypothetical protein